MVLTDAFTKFSQAFITNNQKVLTIAKILVEKMVLCVWHPGLYSQQQGPKFGECHNFSVVLHV